MSFISKWQKTCCILLLGTKNIIINSAKSGQYGHYGDGRIFVSDISEAYTISEETREDDDE